MPSRPCPKAFGGIQWFAPKARYAGNEHRDYGEVLIKKKINLILYGECLKLI